MDEYEARELIQDAASRRALWEILWKAGHAHEKERPIPPPPPDKYIQEELKRILFGKNKIDLEGIVAGILIFSLLFLLFLIVIRI